MVEVQKQLITKTIVDQFILDFESKLVQMLAIGGYKNLNDYANSRSDDPKQKTVEKTKAIAFFYENSFKTVCEKNGLTIGTKSSDGYDVIIDGVEYEMKLTLSLGDSWTGNSYSLVKVKNLILIKISVDDNNKVDGLFFATLNSQNSNWKSSENGKNNSAFSSLFISKEDISNLEIVYGQYRLKRANSKNIGIILEKYSSK